MTRTAPTRRTCSRRRAPRPATSATSRSRSSARSCTRCSRRTAAAPATWRTPPTRRQLLTAEQAKLCAKCHAAGERRLQEGARRVPGRASLHHLPRPALRPTGEAPQARRSTRRSRSGACDACHAAANVAEALRASRDAGGKLCASCHDPTSGRRAAAGRPQAGEGAASASPATTRTRPNGAKLTRARRGRALLHAATRRRARRSAVPHKPLTQRGGCASCHKPHAAQEQGAPRHRAARSAPTCHAKTNAQAEEEGGPQPFASGDAPLPRPARLELRRHGQGALRTRSASPATRTPRRASCKTHTHKPVLDGLCNACHAGHASDQPSCSGRPARSSARTATPTS